MKPLHVADATTAYWQFEAQSLHQDSRQEIDKNCAAKDESVNRDAKEHLEDVKVGLWTSHLTVQCNYSKQKTLSNRAFAGEPVRFMARSVQLLDAMG